MTNLKKPEEYIITWAAHRSTSKRDIVLLEELIEQAQRDAYNQAIDDAVENAELKSEEAMPFSYCECPEYSFDSESILKLKIE